MIFKFSIILVVTYFYLPAFAEFLQTGIIQEQSQDQAVIDEIYLQNINFEDPSFSDLPQQRDVASLSEDSATSNTLWQGQLRVAKEIPYSYPQLTRNQVEVEALLELEKSLRKRKQSEE